MPLQPTRRDFMKSATAATVATAVIPAIADEKKKKKPLFKLSLAQWSLHRAIFGGKIKNEDFAKVTKEEFNISCIEYVNQFFKDKAENMDYLKDLKKRADDLGVKTNLIMCDGEGLSLIHI